MIRDDLMRLTFWASCPFNLAAACLLAFPSSSLGQFAGLPEGVPAIYAALMGFLVALFGAAYAWMAIQTHINRAHVWFFAVGKSGVFVIALALLLAGAASWRITLVASGDLAFASIWFAWLIGSPAGSGARVGD